MATAYAYKAVTSDWKSAGRSSQWDVLGIPPDEWEAFRLDYTIGNTVAPDPATELALKQASAGILIAEHAVPWPNHPAGSAGVYAFDSGGFSAFYLAHNWVAQAPLWGHLVQLQYDDADLLDAHNTPAMDYTCRRLQLASCVVTGEASRDPDTLAWTFTGGWADDSSHVPT